jgi:hypothetical protein
MNHCVPLSLLSLKRFRSCARTSVTEMYLDSSLYSKYVSLGLLEREARGSKAEIWLLS